MLFMKKMLLIGGIGELIMMRNPTSEELESVNNYLKSISVSVEEGLKHCPFCGAEAEVHKNVFAEGTVYTVECISCSCGLDWFDTEEEAIEAWNRRA